MQTAVTQLELQLAGALATEARQKCEDAKAEVQRLRCEGAELLAEFRPLAVQVRDAQNERLKLHGLLVQARNQIATYSSPLNPLTFPSDDEIRAHAEQLETWKQRQKELVEILLSCLLSRHSYFCTVYVLVRAPDQRKWEKQQHLFHTLFRTSNGISPRPDSSI